MSTSDKVFYFLSLLLILWGLIGLILTWFTPKQPSPFIQNIFLNTGSLVPTRLNRTLLNLFVLNCGLYSPLNDIYPDHIITTLNHAFCYIYLAIAIFLAMKDTASRQKG